MIRNEGSIIYINGSVVKGKGMREFKMREMVYVGTNRLVAEVIGLDGETGTVQVYEETEGIGKGEAIRGLGVPLSVELGPGLIGHIFDGIGRPLTQIRDRHGAFIPPGVGLLSLAEEDQWEVAVRAKVGELMESGQVYATVHESDLIEHRLMVPPRIQGKVVFAAESGTYRADETLLILEEAEGKKSEISLHQLWPVRQPRPFKQRQRTSRPLITGQRIFDTFFPIAKGGTAAIPGGFGTGKTMTLHQLAKWSDADIIIYIGCGERGNEMTDVLKEFPKIVDPKSGKAIMDRTILIANTSNMPVAAREASIYTGITIAEYYRDMGYHVAVMADSTSRWAEALREISGRLEEMPAEEGYPAYLPHRLAEFYERAGYVETLHNGEGSITIFGAISPAGGDLSEPVTESTMRFVNSFLALDRKLAYARHYPAINWLSSYSGYLKELDEWYKEKVAEDFMLARNRVMELLQEESELLDIVQLVGEDVLPDSQRLVLEIARIIKTGLLQQNAFHPEDSFVPLEKQYAMVQAVLHLHKRAKACIERGIPLSKARNQSLFERTMKMKYEIPNEQLDGIDELNRDMDVFYDELLKRYG